MIAQESARTDANVRRRRKQSKGRAEESRNYYSEEDVDVLDSWYAIDQRGD